MPVDYEGRRSLSKVRFSRAQDCLSEAEVLLSRGQYKGAANRSYYAVFHAMRAVLALDGIDRKHHSGVISEFMRLYIKTNIFEKGVSDMIGDQYDYRTSSDYDDFFIISKSEVTEQINNARLFLALVKKHLQGRDIPLE